MIWSKQDPEKTPYHSQNPESWPLLLLFLTSYWSTVKSLRSSNSPRGGRGGQLFPLLPSTSIEANKQETAFEAPIWEINKISSEILDKLECGKFETKRGGGVLWGLGVGAGSGNGRNERFCTLDHLYNTINFSCLHNAGKSLQTTPAPCSTCTLFCSVLYCWLGLPWLGANFHRFVSPGVAALVLSATCRGSWVTSSLKYAFLAFSAQPLKPRWTTSKIDYYRRAQRHT